MQTLAPTAAALGLLVTWNASTMDRASTAATSIGLGLRQTFSVAVQRAARASQRDVERFIVSRGPVRLEVLAQGKGPLIVLLPSRGRGVEDYDVIAARIAAAGYRVVLPQPRGIGASTGPLEGLTLHDFAFDIAAVIEHQTKLPAIVVGHAFGNQVARTLAVDRPELVKALVLAAATPRPSNADPAVRACINTSGDATLPEGQRIDCLKKAFFAPGHDPRVWLEGWYPHTNRAQGRATESTPEKVWFSGGTAPILDLQPELDAFRPPAHANVFRDELGASRVTVKVVPHSGHALVPEHPEEVARAIIEYAGSLK